MSNTIDWTVLAVKLDEAGSSWREIADMLKKPKSTVSDFLRGYHAQKAIAEGNDGYDNTRILFISDLHVPYHHKNALPFLEGLKKKYNPTRVICLGDELDHHAMSFHDSDPDLPSAGDELRRALPVIKELEKMFPVMDLIDSNHGSMAFRKAKHHGISKHYIRSYNEVLEVGNGWKWYNDLVLDMSEWGKPDVYVHHGKTKKAVATSRAMSMSHVSGHYHESYGVEFWSNPKGLYFGMNSGCLIDDKQLAFAYNKVFPHRPIIGTTLIINGNPVLEVMEL
jgi:hypothetical protein